MAGISRQTIGLDAYTVLILSLLLALAGVILFGVLYWFYSALKRIETVLLEIKKLLESKTS